MQCTCSSKTPLRYTSTYTKPSGEAQYTGEETVSGLLYSPAILLYTHQVQYSTFQYIGEDTVSWLLYSQAILLYTHQVQYSTVQYSRGGDCVLAPVQPVHSPVHPQGPGWSSGFGGLCTAYWPKATIVLLPGLSVLKYALKMRTLQPNWFPKFIFLCVLFIAFFYIKKNPYTGNTWPSRTCVIQDYRFYTMSLSQYHGCCQYRESISIP